MAILSQIQHYLRERRRRREFAIQFHNEIELLGRRFKESSEPTILFFTLQKCASVYAAKLMADLASDVGLTPIDFDSYFYLGGTAGVYPLNAAGNAADLYRRTGYFFGPFRHLHDGASDLAQFKILLLLRDPRDMLTSHYYSVAHSHYVPVGNPEEAERLRNWRSEAQSKSLDEHVLGIAPIFLERYLQYCDQLVGKPNVLLLKYEDMIYNFNAWLDSILKFTGWNVQADLVRRLREEARAASATDSAQPEDVSKHRRQAQPGDHKRKLKPETIEQLNRQYEPVLRTLHYDL